MTFSLQSSGFGLSPSFSSAATAPPPPQSLAPTSATDQAIAQFETYFTSNNQTQQQNFRNAVMDRFLPAPGVFSSSSGDCHNVNVGGSATEVQAFGSQVPVIGGIISSIAGIFGQHHAQAVAAEATAICNSVPAVNNSFRQIDQALASGEITPAQARDYYDQIKSQFSQAMHTASYKRGDGLWLFDYTCQAICYARSLDADSAYRPAPIVSRSPSPPTQPDVYGASPPPAYLQGYPAPYQSGVLEIPTWAIITGAVVLLMLVILI